MAQFIIQASLIAGLIISGGCANRSSYNTVHASVNPASVIQINRPLSIPNQKARVYIQNGAEIAWRDIEKTSTYCRLRMRDVHKAGEPGITVSPGQFEIIKLSKVDDTYSPGTLVALPRLAIDTPSNVIFEVNMRLQSAEQPDVWALICSKHVNTFGIFHPTLAEIRIALGNVIEIQEP